MNKENIMDKQKAWDAGLDDTRISDSNYVEDSHGPFYWSSNMNIKKNNCEHDFIYSHIETPPMGSYSFIPPDREVVVCRKCGMIIKTNKI